MLKEFREFALRGNVMDLAVGFILGAAFTAIVNSLVNDILMPPIGLLLGGVDFSNLFIMLRPAAGETPAVTINYGVFINNIITFLIVAFAVFMLVRLMNRLYMDKQRGKVEEEPVTKTCPYCAETIPVKAVRCPHCTSQLDVAPLSGV
jgi:large conductance mechanosensitive channel